MGDADDIDLDDKSAKSDKGKAAPEVVAPPADDFEALDSDGGDHGQLPRAHGLPHRRGQG